MRVVLCDVDHDQLAYPERGWGGTPLHLHFFGLCISKKNTVAAVPRFPLNSNIFDWRMFTYFTSASGGLCYQTPYWVFVPVPTGGLPFLRPQTRTPFGKFLDHPCELVHCKFLGKPVPWPLTVGLLFCRWIITCLYCVRLHVPVSG